MSKAKYLTVVMRLLRKCCTAVNDQNDTLPNKLDSYVLGFAP